ncbi:outer membrane protein assembly factor BamB family protein [Acanthopleuribacter pedis]|uniref:PQQ-binding-like beta-propeller repeat protein n=1 Tax=Acanthopleuribacter pedis TaxID=442870 RepID=A0A8J7U3S2_9BACT|nr:PQQ-binding-like beta-propeller repeat protein [Acanthopleuribacter pedis]MBO1319907.1 PQQ-binding-like beta-propeller repeat protein [Acanthopleuribacter pedis]
MYADQQSALKRSCFVAIALLFAPLFAKTDNAWPAFRGPDLNGHSQQNGVFQGKRHLSLKPAWTQKLGSGYSGVVVAEGVAVTMHSDGTNDLIAAFDAASGKPMWHQVTGPMYKGHDGSHDGPIATPLIADGTVFTLGTSGKLFAYALKTGKNIWTQDLAADFEVRAPFYGFGASPMMIDGVLVSLMGGENQAVGGFDPKTGENLWKLGTDQINFQGVMPWKWADQPILLAAGQTKLFGINAKKGELLWEFAHEGTGGRGATSLVPVPAGPGKLFLAHQDDSSQMVEIGRDEAGKATFNKVWQERTIRNSYNVPVYHEGHLYAYSSRFLTCVNAADGKMVWRSRPPGDGFLILVDGHLVIVSKKGSVHIVEATPKGYAEKASVTISEDLAWSHPAFADGAVFVRALDGLSRVTVSDAPAVAAGEDSSAPKGSAFTQFLAKVKAAKKSAKAQKLVDAFMAKQKQTPIVEDGWVHFVYQGDAKDVAIGGDLFGARQERGMYRLAETNLFYYSAELEADAMIAYLFILDYKDMIADPKNPNQSVTTMLGKDMEMSFGPNTTPMSWVAGPDWQAPAYLAKTSGKKGALHEHSFDSAKTEGKVTVQVYTPHGYGEGDTKYPLALIHGGKGALERGEWTKALDNLIGDKVTPTVVAFVTQAPRSRAYADMVTEELLPMLAEKYSLSDKAEHRANIGFGPSGFSAILVTFSHPDKFAKIGTNSAMIMDYTFDMVQGPLANITDEQKERFKVYMDWGRYEFRNPQEAWDLKDYNLRFTGMLEKQGFTVSGEEFPEGTDWTSWRNRTEKMMHTLFPLQGSQM